MAVDLKEIIKRLSELEKRVSKIENIVITKHRKEIPPFLLKYSPDEVAKLPVKEQINIIKACARTGYLESDICKAAYQSLWKKGYNPEVAIKGAHTGLWTEEAELEFKLGQEKRKEWLKELETK